MTTFAESTSTGLIERVRDANIATFDNESDAFINELRFPAGDESFINELEFHEAVSVVQAYESDAPQPPKKSSRNQQVDQYIAPEQAENSHDVDIRADVYGLGCTLYSLLVGVPPFQRQEFATPKQLIDAHQTFDRPSIADLPPELARIIDRMLAIDPGDRFSTPAEVADAISPFTINADVSALLSPRPQSANETDARKESNPVGGRLWKVFPHKKSLVALAILAVIAFAAFGIVLKLKTPYGTVEIETDDKNVVISVSQAGKEIEIINAASGWNIRLKEGRYDLSLKSGDDKFKLSNNTVTVSRDDKIVLRVTLKKTPVARGDPHGKPKPHAGAKRRSYMLEFSGRHGTHLVIPKLSYDGSHPITFEATVMSLYRGSIIGDFNGSGLGLDVADGYCSFHVNDGRPTNNGYAFIKSGTSIGRDRLVHIAGVFDGRQMRLYVAGKLQGKETTAKFKKSKFPFMIGADPGGQGEPTQFLNGIIDEVRVSKTARYDEDFVPPSRFKSDEQTMVLYRFDEGEGDVANDASGNALHGKIHSAKWVVAKVAPGTVESLAIQRLRQIGVKITERNGVATGFAFGSSATITDADLAALESLDTLENLTLIGCVNVTDAGFAHLKNLSRLRQLNLSPSNITDAGLANLKGMKDLWVLGLNSTRVTDAGLKHLIGNRNITVLYLNNTKITDEGLVFLEQMKDMYWMDLESTGLTDVGLARLGHMSKMRLLSLARTRVTDAGLPRLQRFSNLELLGLNSTAVTDAGMVHLAKLSSLNQLILSDTRVTAAGLVHLASLKNLKVLQLLNTQITPAAVEEIRKLLPKDCEIKHSFAPPKQAPPIEVPATATPPGHENHVNSTVFSPDGKILAAGDAAGTVILWDVSTRRKLRSLNNIQVIECVVFSPDGKMLVTADRGSAITFWDVETGREIKRLKKHASAVMSVAYSPEGEMLASAGVRNTVKIWDSASGEVRATLSGHKNAIQEVKFSRSGKKLASVDLDGTLKIWDPLAGELLSTYKVDRSGMGLTFSPDGKTLATANYPPKIQLLDVATGRVLRTLMGHRNRVRDVAFSPDGRVLASAGDDRTVRFWDMESGRQIGILSGHTGRVHDVEFSPDGKTLASASADKTSKVWNVERFTSGKRKRPANYRLTPKPIKRPPPGS